MTHKQPFSDHYNQPPKDKAGTLLEELSDTGNLVKAEGMQLRSLYFLYSLDFFSFVL